MKKILKITSLALLLITSISCENDDQAIATAKGAPQLLTPVTGSSYVLSPENAANELTTLVWNHSDYDVQTAANYEVEVALSGTDFATILSGGTTTSKFMVWTVEGLNSIALGLGITPFEATDIDVRIKSSLGINSELVSYSNVVKINVTPYTTDSPKLYVTGNFLSNSGYGDNWTPANGVPIASSGFGQTDFEGYVYINEPSYAFLFLPTNTSFDNKYGDDGTFSNTLAANGADITGTGAGYYLVKANTTTNTYSLQPTSWAITGSATPLGWPDNGVQDQNMTYNATTKKWEIIIALSAGGNQFKFRANDDWAINFGDDGNDGTLQFNSSNNLSVSASGTYKVELNLSDARNYTWTATLQ